MSMGSFKVNPAQVIEVAGQLRGGASGIKSDLDDLDGKVAALRANWDGQAQIAYDQAQRTWTQQLTEMQQLLENIASKTVEMADRYSSADQQSAGRFA
jgi:6 kDa early secretory antigenic target